MLKAATHLRHLGVLRKHSTAAGKLDVRMKEIECWVNTPAMLSFYIPLPE
jgi:hypothetical protein